MTPSRRRFLGLGAALAVAPRAVLSAPAAPPDWIRREIERLHAAAFAAAGIETGEYTFFSGYASLMTVIPGRLMLAVHLDESEDDDAV